MRCPHLSWFDVETFPLWWFTLILVIEIQNVLLKRRSDVKREVCTTFLRSSYCWICMFSSKSQKTYRRQFILQHISLPNSLMCLQNMDGLIGRIYLHVLHSTKNHEHFHTHTAEHPAKIKILYLYWQTPKKVLVG